MEDFFAQLIPPDSSKRETPGQHFVENYPQGPDIGPPVEPMDLACPLFLAADLLRRHVGPRPPAVTGCGGPGRVADRQAEVQHACLPGSSIMMFPGFRSRCTRPRVCA